MAVRGPTSTTMKAVFSRLAGFEYLRAFDLGGGHRNKKWIRSPRATLMPNQLFILVSPPLDPEMATPFF